MSEARAPEGAQAAGAAHEPAGGAGAERRTHRPDRHMLEALVCPLTHTTLRYDAERQELISEAARLAFPIRDGIPMMLIEEARPLD